MIVPVRPGRLMIQLSASVAAAPAPSHLDVIAGAARPLNTLDGGGALDRALGRRVDAFRGHLVHHARDALGRIGAQGAGFADDEQALGLSRVFHVRLSDPDAAAAAVKALMDTGLVDWAMPEPLVTAPFEATGPVGEREAVQAAMKHRRMVRALEALALEAGDRAIIVAVADTGAALEHPEFAGRMRSGYDTVDLGMGSVAQGVTLVGDSRGRDFCARDETGHGSHVAGIIGAHGVHIPPGLGGRSMIVPVRVLAAARFAAQQSVVGVGSLTDIDAGLKVCIDLGADVINMSFGTPMVGGAEGGRPHEAVIRYALSRGVVPVAAMGNSGKAEDYYPAALPGVIAVAAVDDAGRRSSFSTTGRHCMISAPGEKVVSAGRIGYRESSGTSHAAPFVSGACALLLARARRAGAHIDADQVAAILRDSAEPLTGSSDEIGAGLLNAEAALRLLDRRLPEFERRAA